MKRLNKEEIELMAGALSMTEAEAEEVSNIFADIYEHEQNGRRGWKIFMPLESADDYIREWENHWHRENNWNDYYEYEKENWFDDYDSADEIFETLDTFKEYMMDCTYELKCSGMIIIVG